MLFWVQECLRIHAWPQQQKSSGAEGRGSDTNSPSRPHQPLQTEVDGERKRPHERPWRQQIAASYRSQGQHREGSPRHDFERLQVRRRPHVDVLPDAPDARTAGCYRERSRHSQVQRGQRVTCTSRRESMGLASRRWPMEVRSGRGSRSRRRSFEELRKTGNRRSR